MARFKLYIEYEGTRYSGWQVQKNARTIQGELIGAAKSVFQTSSFELYGAGRTDAGVHALCQVAHLDVETSHTPDTIRVRMNDNLPADIALIGVERVPSTFHARHNAVARSYVYQISRRRTALGKRFVWWVKDELNVPTMEHAAQLFLGLKNFESFTADDPSDRSTKVHIESIELREVGSLILFRIIGSHFLWKMVRQMVGVLVEVGRGTLSINQVKELLHISSDLPATLTAPPSGLFLERVYYSHAKQVPPLRPILEIPSFMHYRG
ncbi:MAG: tRNA pseudouridine(38-40) synthase TruA [Bacteroidetes bacterium]|nr:tRNA pseudouridine(38-40) synthase TruA [Bacteroidota bacterium]